MRKTIIYWSLGLLSVSWLAGCGLLRNDRNGGCDDSGRCRPARGRNGNTTVVEFGPIDNTNHAKTPSNKPGLIAPARPALQEPPLSKAASAPIPAPEGFLPDLKKTDKLLEEPAPITGPAVPKKIEHLDVDLSGSKPITDPAPIKISEPAKTVGKPAEPKQAPITSGQSDNFKVVTGQVSLYRKTWRLRYAGIDQDDAYGGVLVLEGGAELSKLRDGQTVRVRGTLIPPADRNGTASYRVTAIELLD